MTSQTKPSVSQQVKDHVVVWLVNNPDHAIRIEKVRKWLHSLSS